MPLHTLVLVFGFVLAFIGAFWSPPRVSFIALAVACLALAQLVP